jgi:hypothetical protein
MVSYSGHILSEPKVDKNDHRPILQQAFPSVASPQTRWKVHAVSIQLQSRFQTHPHESTFSPPLREQTSRMLVCYNKKITAIKSFAHQSTSHKFKQPTISRPPLKAFVIDNRRKIMYPFSNPDVSNSPPSYASQYGMGSNIVAR